MATAFQVDAFQFGGFQGATEDVADVVGTARLTVGLITIVAKGKHSKYWPRLGPAPDHDTEYVRWLNKLPRNIPEVAPNAPPSVPMAWSDGSGVTWSDGQSVDWSIAA